MAGSSNDANLERTPSQMSTASRKSVTVKARSRQQSLVTPTSAKTLESFPSLSPDISPSALKQDKQLVASPKPKSPDQSPRRSSKTSPSIVESLITSTPSFRGRSALFEDSPKSPPMTSLAPFITPPMTTYASLSKRPVRSRWSGSSQRTWPYGMLK